MSEETESNESNEVNESPAVEASSVEAAPVAEAPKADVGIENLLEIYAAAEQALALVGRVLEDGRVSAKDFMHVAEEFKNFDVYVDAFKDADEALAEAKNLSEQEMIVLAVQSFRLAKAVASAFKKKK